MKIIYDGSVSDSLLKKIEKLNGYEGIKLNDKDVIKTIKDSKAIFICTNDEENIKKIMQSSSVGTSTYIITERNLNINNSNLYAINEDTNIQDLLDKIKISRKPSEEKIWNRYYTDKQLDINFPEMNQNDFIRSQNIDPNLIAYRYFASTMTYQQREEKIKKYASILKKMGVKEGDFVSLCMANTPEIMNIRYAVEELGAVANFIFPITDSERLKYCINEGKSKLLFILDSNYKELRKIIDETTLDNVVLMTPFESLPLMKNGYDSLQKIKGYRPTDNHYIQFSKFEKIDGCSYVSPQYFSNRLSSIQYTSGTTGTPKAVEISGKSYVDRITQYRSTDIDYSYDRSTNTYNLHGQKYLLSLPICGVAYGEFMAFMCFANGEEGVLIPRFTPDKLASIIKKNNIQAASTTPSGWFSIVNSKDFKNIDLSKFKLAAVGGEMLTKHDDEFLSHELNSKGFNGHIICGNGCTEGVITNATNQNGIYKPGTSGICLPKNSVKIVGPNGEELSYGSRGDIIYGNKSPMIQYHDNDEMTKKIKDDFGVKMGDYGSIDTDGFVTTFCRNSDIIDIEDKKYAPSDFTDVMYKIPEIKRCITLKSNDSMVRAHIYFILKPGSDYSKINSQIKQLFDDKIINYLSFCCVNNIPLSLTGKADSNELQNNSKKYINVKYLHYCKKNKLN